MVAFTLGRVMLCNVTDRQTDIWQIAIWKILSIVAVVSGLSPSMDLQLADVVLHVGDSELHVLYFFFSSNAPHYIIRICVCAAPNCPYTSYVYTI